MSTITVSGSTGIAAAQSGEIVQMVYGTNYSQGTKVFTAWNTFEEVPGNLRATITPKSTSNKIIISAKLHWGGFYGTTDVAANFRIMKSTNGGTSWSYVGNYNTDAGLGQQATIGVGTGLYRYNMGDTNASSMGDNILMADLNVTSTSSTIYAVHWACGYAPNTRTLYWNRTVNTSNAYNSTHINTITLTEIKG